MAFDSVARALAIQAGRAALPATARPKLALLGDSRAWSSHATSAPYVTIAATGIAFQVMMQTGGRVDFPQRLNFGVGGITCADINSRSFAYIAANNKPAGTQSYDGYQPQPLANTPGLTPLEACAQSDADLVIYLASTNGRAAGIAPATDQAAILTAVTRLRQAGKLVFLITELPRGDSVNPGKRLAGQQLSYHLRMAQWLRSIRIPGVTVINAWPTVALAASTTGDAVSGAFYDGLHLGFPGAYLLGARIADAVETLYPPFDLLPSSNSDLWSADNPSGSLNANPMMADLSVTPTAKAGVTVTGQLPAGWQHDPSDGGGADGLTIAYGSTTVDGVACLTATVTGTPANASPRLALYSSIAAGALAGIAGGDVLQTVGQAFVQAGATGYAALTLDQVMYAAGNGSTPAVQRAGGAPVSGSAMTTVPGAASARWGGTFATEPLVHDGSVLGTNTRLRWLVYFTQGQAVNATFLFGPATVRKLV